MQSPPVICFSKSPSRMFVKMPRVRWTLSLVQLSLLGDAHKHGVAAEEGHNADHDEILDRRKHVELQPEVEVEREYGAEADVEAERRQGEGEGLPAMTLRWAQKVQHICVSWWWTGQV